MFKWKTLAAFALAACGSAFAANNMFSDVPRTHWAYEAIDRAVAAGILQGYDGKFHGDKLVNRYQMAVIIKKILDNVGGAGGAVKAGMKPEDVKNLEQLTIEFADELALLNTKVSTLEDSFVQLRGEVDKMKGGSGAGAGKGEGLTNAFTGIVSVAFVSTDDGTVGTSVTNPVPAGPLGPNGIRTRYTAGTPSQVFFTIPQASIALDKEVSEGIGLHVQYDYGTDLLNGGAGVGLNEAYLMVDELFGDIGAKIGGFALPMQSWEVNGPFRTCQMTITPSVINTGFEAARVVGLEIQKMKDVDPSDVQWRVGIFNGNDTPTGAVLAGTMTDNAGIAGLGRSATFDDQFGFFISLESGNDPDKSWGWRLDWIDLGGDSTGSPLATPPVPPSNEFDGWQVGFWWKNEDFKVMLQYLDGTNQFGATGPGNKNDVTAWYVLLNYKFNEDNSLTVRYDDWKNDINAPSLSGFDTSGDAFTFAWNHKTSDTSMFQFEWLTPDEKVKDLTPGLVSGDAKDDLVQFRYKVWF